MASVVETCQKIYDSIPTEQDILTEIEKEYPDIRNTMCSYLKSLLDKWKYPVEKVYGIKCIPDDSNGYIYLSMEQHKFIVCMEYRLKESPISIYNILKSEEKILSIDKEDVIQEYLENVKHNCTTFSTFDDVKIARNPISQILCLNTTQALHLERICRNIVDKHDKLVPFCITCGATEDLWRPTGMIILCQQCFVSQFEEEPCTDGRTLYEIFSELEEIPHSKYIEWTNIPREIGCSILDEESYYDFRNMVLGPTLFDTFYKLGFQQKIYAYSLIRFFLICSKEK